MDRLIPVGKLIEKAQQENIDLGKGNPYNRLRYYTKINWLPNMKRKLSENNRLEGHYPTWALETLKTIDALKKKGLTNEEIEKRIKRKNTVSRTFSGLSLEKVKRKTIGYVLIALILLVLLTELNIVNLNKPKNVNLSLGENVWITQIVDNGVAFMPKDSNAVFVKTDLIQPNSKINVTFKENYTPASRYWVENIKDTEGFELKTDVPVADSSSFYWWISN
jgi:hypothetical protein